MASRLSLRRVAAAGLLVAGFAVVGDAGVASGEAAPEVWEPPPGEVFAGPPGDGPHPEDVPLRVGDVVARGTRGPDGECIDPPGGVGVGFTPPSGYTMSVRVRPVPETCEHVISSIEIREDLPTTEPDDYGPYGGGRMGPRDVPGGVRETAPAPPQTAGATS